MSDSKVKVLSNKEGQVVVISKHNAEYGHIRVSQERMVIDDNTGFAKLKPLTALIPGTVADLKGFGWKDGDEVNGKIRIVEQLIPFNKKEEDRDLKIAGKTGITCSQNGQPIYRKNFFTFNLKLEDKLEEHTNNQEISEAYALLKENASAGIQPNEDFNL